MKATDDPGTQPGLRFARVASTAEPSNSVLMALGETRRRNNGEHPPLTAIRRSTYPQPMPRLSTADYEAVLAVLHEAGEVEGAITFPKPVLEALRQLVRCDVVTYHEDIGGEAGLASAGEPRGSIPPDYRESCKRYWHQDRLEPTTRARKVLDLLSRREFHRIELYQYAAGPVGIEDMFRLWVDPASGSGARFEFDRGRPDFSERDRDVLDILSPHLAQLRKRAAARQRASLPWTANPDKLT